MSKAGGQMEGMSNVLPDVNHEIAWHLKTNSRDVISAIRALENKVSDLIKNLKVQLEKFLTEEDVDVTVQKLFAFLPRNQSELNKEGKSVLQVSSDSDEVISLFLIEDAGFRKLLAIALCGSEYARKELFEGELSRSERFFLETFIDYLMSGLLEAIDPISNFDVARTPVFVSPEIPENMCETIDLVGLSVSVKIDDLDIPIDILMPLAAFNEGENNRDEVLDRSGLTEKECAWAEKLFAKVEETPIDLYVELASGEIDLSKVDNITVGQRFELPIDPSRIKVRDMAGDLLFMGDLKLQSNDFILKVRGVDS